MRFDNAHTLLILFALVVKVSAEALLGKPFVSSGTVELVAVMGHFGGTIAGLTVATLLVRAALSTHNGMATFDEAGVSKKA